LPEICALCATVARLLVSWLQIARSNNALKMKVRPKQRELIKRRAWRWSTEIALAIALTALALVYLATHIRGDHRSNRPPVASVDQHLVH